MVTVFCPDPPYLELKKTAITWLPYIVTGLVDILHPFSVFLNTIGTI